jgi:hypothetical protein
MGEYEAGDEKRGKCVKEKEREKTKRKKLKFTQNEQK